MERKVGPGKGTLSIKGDGTSRLILQFSYDEEMIKVVRSIPGRKWDSTAKVWSLPDTDDSIQSLLHKLYESGMYLYSKDQSDIRDNHGSDFHSIGMAELQRRWRLKGYSPNTIKVYTRQIGYFFDRTGLEADKVQRQDIMLYFDALSRTLGISRSTVVHVLSSLKQYYDLLFPMKANPANGIPYPKKSRQYPDILSRKEVSRLLEGVHNPKHKFLLSLIYSCGLRVGEAVVLKVDDLDFDRNLIHIRMAKGRKDRYVMFSEVLKGLLKLYQRDYVIRSWLFPGRDPSKHIAIRTAQAVFEQSCERSKITKKVSIHSLRHAFATHLLEDGVDLRYIQELLGHQSSKTTEIYTHVCRTDIRRITSPLDKIGEGDKCN